jgi:hypothetical protein
MSTKPKPLRVSAEWIEYAHGPGSEDGQPLATQLCDLLSPASAVMVDDPDLVAEIVSVAELYTSDTHVQEDDRLWFRGYPKNIIRRGRAWLAKYSAA